MSWGNFKVKRESRAQPVLCDFWCPFKLLYTVTQHLWGGSQRAGRGGKAAVRLHVNRSRFRFVLPLCRLGATHRTLRTSRRSLARLLRNEPKSQTREYRTRKMVKMRRGAVSDVNQALHIKTTHQPLEEQHGFKTGGPVINNNFIRPKLL